MNFLSEHSLLRRDTEFGKAWCWLVACHLLTRQEATHPVKRLFQDINCLRPFSRRGILSHFPRRPPRLKYHLFFIYLFLVFVCYFLGQWLSQYLPNTRTLCLHQKLMRLWKTKGSYRFSGCFQRSFSGKAAGRKVPAGSAARTCPVPTAPARWPGTGARSRGQLGPASTRGTLVEVNGLEMVAVP